MEMTGPGRLARLSKGISIALLVLLVAGLTASVFIASDGAGRADDEREKEAFLRLAVVSGVLLAMALVLLLWTFLRLALGRFHSPRLRKPTPFVDAWAEAGRRVRLEEDPPVTSQAGIDWDEPDETDEDQAMDRWLAGSDHDSPDGGPGDAPESFDDEDEKPDEPGEDDDADDEDGRP